MSRRCLCSQSDSVSTPTARAAIAAEDHADIGTARGTKDTGPQLTWQEPPTAAIDSELHPAAPGAVEDGIKTVASDVYEGRDRQQLDPEVRVVREIRAGIGMGLEAALQPSEPKADQHPGRLGAMALHDIIPVLAATGRTQTGNVGAV